MSLDVNRVELTLSAMPSGTRGVVLNGIPLDGVKAVSVTAAHDRHCEVTLTLLAEVNYSPGAA